VPWCAFLIALIPSELAPGGKAVWDAIVLARIFVARIARQLVTVGFAWWLPIGGRVTGHPIGVSYHNLGSWWSLKLKQRENAVMPPKKGKPQLYNQIAMQNEITAMLNDSELKEWRGLSVWCCHRTAAAHDLAFQVFFRRMKELSDPAVYEQRAAGQDASLPCQSSAAAARCSAGYTRSDAAVHSTVQPSSFKL